ncbi:MAG TPA: contractile injection system tape measure protein, partial [Phenylobacterium sp.]
MSAHVIENLSFEFAFASGAQARDLHGRVGDFARDRLLPVIDKVFDEFSEAGEVVRLDHLEVLVGGDLWTLGEAEAEALVREALRDALADALAPGPVPRADGPAPERLDRARADLELVWEQLGSGRMTWRADDAARADFDGLVMRVLDGFGPQLAARLREASDWPLRLARLARQWPAGQVARLEQFLSPGRNPAPGPDPVV